MSGRWQINSEVLQYLNLSPEHSMEYLNYYSDALESQGKFNLTIWPYHAMLGGIGHALVPSFEEAVFFHSIVRFSQPNFEMKGMEPLTEHYSAIGPEITKGPGGETLGKRSDYIFQLLKDFDAIIIAGQAKSHCVAWTVDDLLKEIKREDPTLAGKVYLLADCTSPVVIPGVADYTDMADEAYSNFAAAGMHIVRSIDPINNWPR